MDTELTIGVEEEYQLVDAASGDLRSRARDVLDVDWTREIHPEIHQTMLEVGTRICTSAADLGEEVRRLRIQVASAAAAEDLRVVAAGLHPFSHWEVQRPTETPRYAGLLDRFGRVILTEHVFGMHIHVGMPAGRDRLQLMNTLRGYVPHLVALAASSPIYESRDTGYASYRTVLSNRLPHSGIPPRLASEEEFARFVEIALRSGVLHDRASIYWSIRPHARYGTLEFRATDVCPRIEDAVAIAALVRAMVAHAADSEPDGPSHYLSASAMDALLEANQWQASRFGLDAMLASPGQASGQESVRDSVRRLVDSVAPMAEAMGDGEALAGVERILERGNGASRIHAALEECGDLSALVRWLVGESALTTGLDRRQEQREQV